MFAVVKTGGKQYRVEPGDVLRVEKLAAEPGEKLRFSEVLMLGGDEVVVGTPLVEGAAVVAEVLDQVKGEKVVHFVRRRRKHSSKRTRGHRQQLTVVRITDILADASKAADLREALGAGQARRAGVAAPAPKARKAAPAPAAAEAEVEPRKPGNLLDAPRGGQPDDLKKISGVGPKLEKLLHENGVFHYDQIAAWTPEEVAWMDEQLSFKGRIEREGWIEQAKKLAEGKE
ncbi:MAG: 50S ribosomal protein L21 [Alphaproteobacteria bacterium]|nr:MAG: 50S ribosomal protein L21 [Alphaproteobacteria bacterium]